MLHILFFICCFLKALDQKARSVPGIQQWPYQAVARALEIIPKTLVQNCGGNSIRTLTALRVMQNDVAIVIITHNIIYLIWYVCCN